MTCQLEQVGVGYLSLQCRPLCPACQAVPGRSLSHPLPHGCGVLYRATSCAQARATTSGGMLRDDPETVQHAEPKQPTHHPSTPASAACAACAPRRHAAPRHHQRCASATAPSGWQQTHAWRREPRPAGGPGPPRQSRCTDGRGGTEGREVDWSAAFAGGCICSPPSRAWLRRHGLLWTQHAAAAPSAADRAAAAGSRHTSAHAALPALPATPACTYATVRTFCECSHSVSSSSRPCRSCAAVAASSSCRPSCASAAAVAASRSSFRAPPDSWRSVCSASLP